MYHTWYIRKAAVKLFIGLCVTLAIWGSGIATDEKSAEASNKPGTSLRPAESTRLQHLRVGLHKDFTRIVLDSQGPRPLSIGPPSSHGISIRYQNLDLLFDPERFSRTYPGAIARASYQREEQGSKILIAFRQPDTRVKTSFLEANPPQKGFYRLIIDLYPPHSSAAKEAVLPRAETDLQKPPKTTAKISGSAPEASPTPKTISATWESEEPQKIRALVERSKPTMKTAQLQETDPNAEKPGESSAQSREIIPLEVQTRPTIRGPVGYTSRYFHIARPKLGLGLSYEFEEERRENPNSDSKVTSNEFRQRLAIETNGWIYHPALCKYVLRFEPEFTQVRRVSDPGETFTDNPFQPWYFVDAYFLEPKPYTLHGFANRREIKLRGAFATPSDTTIDTYGGDLRFKYKVLPTFLKYTHTDTDQTGFFESTGKRDDFQLSSRHVTRRSTTSLTSLYSDDERTSGGVTTRVKTFSGDLGNDFDIAGDRRKRLLSTLSYRWSESDTSDDTFFQFRENFFWRHTPKLYTDYLLSFETSDSNDFERDTGTLRAKLQHLLYENLTTTVQAGAVLNDTSAGRQNIYDGNLDLLYRRKIPWGTLNLRADLDYTLTDREGFDEDFIQVTNEPHALTTGEVTLLDNQNVDIDSIVVTDTTGTILFVEGIDYTIEQIGTFTRISRTLVGAIANGQTVLVDYRFISDPDFDDSVFGQAYDIQLFLWNALSLRYGYLKIKQDIISGPPPENTLDDTGHAAEIRLDLGWTDTRLTYEDRDRSSGTSTTRWRASQTFRFRPLRRFLADLTGFYGETDFKDTDQTQEEYGLSGRVFWTPAGWCRFRLEGFWNNISGDLQDTEDINIIGGLDLSYRIWSGGIFYRFSNLRNNEQKQIRHNLRVELIRILW